MDALNPLKSSPDSVEKKSKYLLSLYSLYYWVAVISFITAYYNTTVG